MEKHLEIHRKFHQSSILHTVELLQRLGFDKEVCHRMYCIVLSRKDMEKHLEIHRKFHQSSILHTVELLRRLGFDKEVCHRMYCIIP